MRFLLFSFLVFFASNAQAERAKILVSIKPLYSIAKNIAGEAADVDLIVQKGAANNAPDERAIKRKITQSNIIIYTHEALEKFMPGYLRQAALGKQIIDFSKLSGVGTFEGDDYRLWMNEKNLRIIAAEIAARLAALDPDNSGIFDANRRAFDEKITKMHNAFLKRTARLNKKKFIVIDDNFNSIWREYNLQPVRSLNFDDNASLGVSEIYKMRYLIEDEKIICVMHDAQVNPDLIEKIAQGYKVKTASLDADMFGAEESENLIFAIYQNNFKNIANCLK